MTLPKCPKCGGPVCAWCGRHVRLLERYGRPPKYCSEKHKRMAERQRAKDRRKQVSLDLYNGDDQHV